MENNVNFREDLMVEYLNQLVRYGNDEEFRRVYPSMERYLIEKATKSVDKVVLGKINDILAYRKQSLEIKL